MYSGGKTFQQVTQATHRKERGNALFAKGSYREAIEIWGSAIGLVAGAASSRATDLIVVLRTNRAAGYLKIGDPERALGECECALAASPRCVKALFRKAQAHNMLGSHHEALRAAMALKRVDPSNARCVALISIIEDAMDVLDSDAILVQYVSASLPRPDEEAGTKYDEGMGCRVA